MRSGLEARRTISGGMTEYARRAGLKQPPTVVAQFQVGLLPYCVPPQASQAVAGFRNW